MYNVFNNIFIVSDMTGDLHSELYNNKRSYWQKIDIHCWCGDIESQRFITPSTHPNVINSHQFTKISCDKKERKIWRFVGWSKSITYIIEKNQSIIYIFKKSDNNTNYYNRHTIAIQIFSIVQKKHIITFQRAYLL